MYHLGVGVSHSHRLSLGVFLRLRPVSASIFFLGAPTDSRGTVVQVSISKSMQKSHAGCGARRTEVLGEGSRWIYVRTHRWPYDDHGRRDARETEWMGRMNGRAE